MEASSSNSGRQRNCFQHHFCVRLENYIITNVFRHISKSESLSEDSSSKGPMEELSDYLSSSESLSEDGSSESSMEELPDYPKDKEKENQEETEETELDLLMKKKKMEEGSLRTRNCLKMLDELAPFNQPTIREGDIYCIPEILSSSSRDYLIKHNYDQVPIDQLSGKFVLLYFWVLSDSHTPHTTHPMFNADLEDTYSIYKGNFEVVFVALGNNKDAFDKSFSPLPWLAIPHEDHGARYLFLQNFSLSYIPSSLQAFLFDPNGKALQTHALSAIEAFGADGFPFTSKRIEEINLQCDGLWSQFFSIYEASHNLQDILGHYVISSEGDQVPISDLQGKTVGLYFFELGPCGLHRTKKLLEIYKSLKKECKSFEIVMINTDRYPIQLFSKDNSMKMFKCTIPWYILPYDGRKMSRIFNRGLHDDVPDAGYFIILKRDRYSAMSYFAYNILEVFGIDAYPFTLEKAVTVAKSKQEKELVLSDLLDLSVPLSRGKRGVSTRYKDGDTITVSTLEGKHVLLLFATYLCYELGSFLPALEKMYEAKTADDDFEIIYVSLDCCKKIHRSSFYTSILGMPWFVYPYDRNFAVRLFQVLFDHECPQLPAILAFGKDGHLETKESNLAFKRAWNLEYPFIEADMGEEVCYELIERHKWDLQYLCRPCH